MLEMEQVEHLGQPAIAPTTASAAVADARSMGLLPENLRLHAVVLDGVRGGRGQLDLLQRGWRTAPRRRAGYLARRRQPSVNPTYVGPTGSQPPGPR
jgi:hypothetical protein